MSSYTNVQYSRHGPNTWPFDLVFRHSLSFYFTNLTIRPFGWNLKALSIWTRTGHLIVWISNVQKRSEYQTCWVFKWSKPVWLINGMVFECHLKTRTAGPFEKRSKWQLFWMVGTISRPFRYRTIFTGQQLVWIMNISSIWLFSNWIPTISKFWLSGIWIPSVRPLFRSCLYLIHKQPFL